MDKKVTTTFKDAIALLTEDHKHVKAAFKEFEELGDRAFATKKKIADRICAELTAHTIIEEEIFYPAVREQVKEGEDLVDEAVVEHQSARELIAQIQAMTAEDDLFDAKVKVLSEQIEHHVKEEESEMFPKAKKSELDLVVLGEKMAARKEEVLSQPM